MSFHEIVGIIATSSLISVLASHFLEQRRSRAEREHLLQKEIYFKLQEKADDILMSVYLYREQVNTMGLHLKHHVTKLDDLSKEKLEASYGIKRERISNCVFIFFPEIHPAYEEYLLTVGRIADVYFTVAKKNELEQKDIDAFFAEMKIFHEKDRIFTEALRNQIEKQRQRIR